MKKRSRAVLGGKRAKSSTTIKPESALVTMMIFFFFFAWQERVYHFNLSCTAGVGGGVRGCCASVRLLLDRLVKSSDWYASRARVAKSGCCVPH